MAPHRPGLGVLPPATPTLYYVNVLPTAPILVLPEVRSERREYVPIGWLEPRIRLRVDDIRAAVGRTRPGTFVVIGYRVEGSTVRGLAGRVQQ